MSLSKKVYTFIFSFFFPLVIFANTFSINCLELSEKSFFTASDGGFITEWGSDGIGKHYQVSRHKIKDIKKNPCSMDLAIYESDSFSMNKVFVLDWNSLAKKFVLSFEEKVTLLSYSQRGSLLFVGTEKSTYIFHASTGTLINEIKDFPYSISLVKTGLSEKNAVFYSATGSLIYYDLKKLKVLKAINTEANLKNVLFFDKFLTGIKNQQLYLIDTKTGLTEYKEKVSPLLLFTSASDENLFFLSKSNKNTYKISKIEYSHSKISVSLFSDFSSDGEIFLPAFVGQMGNRMYVSSLQGDIYTVENNVLQSFSKTLFAPILDFACYNQKLFLLTEKNIINASYSKKTVTPIENNPDQKNIAIYDKSIILWTKDSKKPIQLLKEPEYKNETLFTPKNVISKLNVCLNNIVFVVDKSEVYIIDLESKKTKLLYTGTSVEDAILIGKDSVYIAKAENNATDSAIIKLNMKTGEIVPVKTLNGFMAYSLTYDSPNFQSDLYGLLLEKDEPSSKIKTKLFLYNSNKENLSKSIFTLNEEDMESCAFFSYPCLYTNLGGNNLYSYNIQNKKSSVYRRSLSLSKKIQGLNDYIVSLGMDGSLTWYKEGTPIPLSSWYLTIQGNWYEF